LWDLYLFPQWGKETGLLPIGVLDIPDVIR